jgi:tetratricopeptide (TPR) repeat protein
MIKQVFFAVICFTILFSVQTTYAQEELSLPEGKNIKEWESISAALVVEKRFEEAIIYLDKVLDKEPDNLKALSNKASLLIQLERFSESISLSNKVLKVDPDRISTLTNKAIALKMIKDYEESFITFTKIMMLEPDNENVKNARAILLRDTPTIPTTNSKYEVHAQIIVRDENTNLIATIESTNARVLESIFTESWWERLDETNNLVKSSELEIFSKINPIIPQDDYIGMITFERQIEGYNINLFEVFVPMIQLEETDEVQVKWTIIKK